MIYVTTGTGGGPQPFPWGCNGEAATKTRHDFQLEIEDELRRIEDDIDEMRRERTKEEKARAHKKGASQETRTAGPLILPGDD